MLRFDVRDMRELSGVGDNFVNLIYSLALSNALKKPMGKKVSNYILAEALIRSGLREKAGGRLDKHGMADFVECAIFHAWLKEKISIEECVEILTQNLKDVKEQRKIRDASIKAFTELLKYIKMYI